jgi:hypothetical protein
VAGLENKLPVRRYRELQLEVNKDLGWRPRKVPIGDPSELLGPPGDSLLVGNTPATAFPFKLESSPGSTATPRVEGTRCCSWF